MIITGIIDVGVGLPVSLEIFLGTRTFLPFSSWLFWQGNIRARIWETLPLDCLRMVKNIFKGFQ